MSDAIIVISNSDIQKDELVDFLPTVGVEIVENPNDPFFGYLGKGDLYIWIAISKTGLRELREGEPDEFEVIRQKLGGEPRTVIVLEMSRRPGNKLFAYELAALLAREWPCVVDNVNGYNRQILSNQELFKLLESGCRFEGF